MKQFFLPLVDTNMTKGRGRGKLPPQVVATQIIKGLSLGRSNTDIGKVKTLRLIQRVLPRVASRIMKEA